MRDEIIRRNTIITVISLIIFFLLSLYVTSYNNHKKMEDDLINISNILNQQIMATTSENEIQSIVREYTTNPNWVRIYIANSLGSILIDSTTDTPTQSLSVEELKIASLNQLDNERIYVDDAINMISYITRINEDIIVKTSINGESNTDYILNSIFYMLLLIIGVLIISIIYNKRTSDMIVDVFNNVSDHLKTVNEGNYERINTEHKYIEVRTSLKEINEINENISRSILKIRNESDKINFIINNMKQGIMIVDQEGKLLIINEYALQCLHINKKPVENALLTSTITNEEVLSKIEGCLVNTQNKTFDYHDCLTGNIYSFTISHLENSWHSDSDNIKVMVVLIMNVTEDRKNEEAKAEFIANASHELKTPVTSISGFSELIINGYGECDEKTRKFIERIYIESKRMKDTIDELLYLSNLEYHGNQVQLTEIVELSPIITESIVAHQEVSKEKNVSFILEVKPLNVLGNSILIRNLIDNLIDNAIKYNKENGTILIKIHEIENAIQLVVKDTGIGMEEKNLNRIFDRFYRIDGSRNRLTGGTGLGLTIVKKVCSVHKATLDVKSVISEGTEFTITFQK